MSLAADEITAMQATLTDSLPDTVQVQRVTLASNNAGGRTDSWAVLATVAARVSPVLRPGGEVQAAGRVEAQKRWIVTLPSGTDVTTRDRIVWGSRTFEVSGVQAARSWELSRRVECVERA